ncbi:helix-turn-helix transcriptional regulator [Gilvimarinus japonicus]|uniref:Helix-turn-helix transcriptional regulator n=1 Tax=Gilvimarinus japonicus TaxID=1796469 RepID=A0ABV7HT45_9GAMM
MQTYVADYFKHDMTHLAILTGEPHSWIASNLMPNRAEVESTPAYDWSRRNNILYCAGATLFRDAKHTCVFIHNRSELQGEYQPEEMIRFEALSPYIEHAMKMRIELSSSANDTVYIRAALNKMRVPVALLNEFGELITQNQSMQAFLQEQSQLMIAGGTHLRLQNENINKTFQHAITQSVAITKDVDLGYNEKLAPVEREDGTKAFIGVDSIIEEQAGRSTFRGAMVYVLAPELVGHLSEQSLQRMFQLTNAEARVCQRFSLLESAKEIAQKEDKSVYTVREQLRTIFEKTGVSNQMQLVNLLASIPAPRPC